MALDTNKQDKTDANKKRFLEELETARGIITTAAQNANVARSQVYHWLEVDAEFKAAVEAVNESCIDWVEGHLHKQIERGEVAATIFYLKTKAKKRGYVERNENRQVDEQGNTVNSLTLKIIRDTASSIAPGDFTPQPASGTESGEKV